MSELQILRDLGVVVLAATALLLVLRRVHLPPILAYIVAGLLAGPLTGVLQVSHSVELFSELGIALLLFLVGLELSLARIRDVGKVALLAGTLQVGITTAGGAGIAVLLGFPFGEAVLLGLALAFSSTVVVVKLLDRNGDLGTLHGRIAVGILLVQDVVVALALTMLSGAGGGSDPMAVAQGLGGAFLGMGVLAAAAAVGVRWVMPPVVRWCSSSPEALFVVGLAWCFAFIVGAETLHVSLELGAFIAGVALAQLRWAEELRRRVHPLVDFFLAVFFVALGAGLDPAAAATLWPAVLALSAFVLVGKPLVVALLLTRFGYGRRTGVLAGLALGQASEFGLVLTTLAVGAGMADESMLSLVGLVALVTIGGSAVLMPRGRAVQRGLERRGLLAILGRGGEEPADVVERSGHVVVVGMNSLGRRLVHALSERGERVLAVDTDAGKLEGLPAETLVGSTDQLATLDEAGVRRARLVVTALQIEDANELLAWRCRSMGVPISVHAFLPSMAADLRRVGADHLMISKHDGVRRLAAELQDMGVMR
ncbi:MAG: cation:proton antiporter [Gemmatimonadetes bacterium]|nr:cation:proton antiporter [Gemmatimonadota bacterium]